MRLRTTESHSQYINSELSQSEQGLFLNWLDDPNKAVRTATQILASHSIVIRELEKEGKVPLGVYEHSK